MATMLKYEISSNSFLYRLKQQSSVFHNRRVAARYRTLASIIPGRERDLNVIFYLSTSHIVCISVLIFFKIMP